MGETLSILCIILSEFNSIYIISKCIMDRATAHILYTHVYLAQQPSLLVCVHIFPCYVYFLLMAQKNFPKPQYHFTFERSYFLAIFPEARMKMYDTTGCCHKHKTVMYFNNSTIKFLIYNLYHCYRSL